MKEIQSVEEFDSMILNYIARKIEDWEMEEHLKPEEVLKRIEEGNWELDCPNLFMHELDAIPEDCLMCSDGKMWDGNCLDFSDEEKAEFGLLCANMSACEECWTMSYLITKQKIDNFFVFWRLENE